MQLFEKQYQWFKGSNGDAVGFKKFQDDLAASSIFLLGENHDRADHHLWQRDTLAILHQTKRKVAVGFEMLPKRIQPVLDQLSGTQFSKEEFSNKTGWCEIWGFDLDLYWPIIDYCKGHALPMIALNCNRPLVSKIGKEGWENQPMDLLEGISPAKPATTAYRAYLFDVTGGCRPGRAARNPLDPAFDRFVRAQQVWDRAFACRIAEYKKERPDCSIVGIIGRGHLEYFGGTPYQLADLNLPCTVLLPVDNPDNVTGAADYFSLMADE